jgi:hypothetical protein
MPWYKFRVFNRYGIRADDNSTTTYRYYEQVPTDEQLENDIEEWAMDVPNLSPNDPQGGVRTEIYDGTGDHPPLKWLQRKLEGACALRDQLNSDIAIYEAEIDRIQNSKTVPVTSDKEEGT